MTKMIETRAGQYTHPQDYIRRRRWTAITTPHQR